jgi:hypothetical protein
MSKPYQLALFGSASMTIEKARKMSKDCSFELLKAVKKEFPTSSPYQKKKAKESGKDPLLDEIAFRISFWDDNLDRPRAPDIAEIRYAQGDCEYYTADDNQRLVLVFSEAAEDASTRLP